MAFTPKSLLAFALSAATLAPAATAGDWDISFGKRSKHGSVAVRVGSDGFGLGIRTPSRAPYRAPYRAPRHSCTWDRGHFETVSEQVWVPGYTEQVWVPAQYESWIDQCGTRRQRLVRDGFYEHVHHPGRYECQTRKVWVPGRKTCGCDHRSVRYGGIRRTH